MNDLTFTEKFYNIIFNIFYSTFNHECPSYIQLHIVQKNGEYVLEIFNTNFNHLNHPANSKVSFLGSHGK